MEYNWQVVMIKINDQYMATSQPYQESGKSQLQGHPLHRRKKCDRSNQVMHYNKQNHEQF